MNIQTLPKKKSSAFIPDPDLYLIKSDFMGMIHAPRIGYRKIKSRRAKSQVLKTYDEWQAARRQVVAGSKMIKRGPCGPLFSESQTITFEQIDTDNRSRQYTRHALPRYETR